MDDHAVRTLAVIDATLAGEPVDPEHAELAELALLLAAERPQIEAGFASELDARVARRFASQRPPRRHVRLLSLPALGAAATALAGVIAVGAVLSSGGTRSTGAAKRPPAAAGPARTAEIAASAPARAAKSAHVPGGARALGALSPAAAGTFAASAANQAAIQPGAPAPLPNGRRQTQSAQMTLATTPAHLDTVAQQVFNAVHAASGIVQSSQVNAAADPSANAEFQLSIPSQSLSTFLNALANLRYAQTVSRSDSTQDVNGAYLNDQHRLAGDEAKRARLEQQLRQAPTAALQAALAALNRQIAADQGELARLQHRISYTPVSVIVQGDGSAVAPGHGSSGGGFTIGRAARDAGHVLTVAAGVALIALAVLLPCALIGALAVWIAATLRRRRREQALDLA